MNIWSTQNWVRNRLSKIYKCPFSSLDLLRMSSVRWQRSRIPRRPPSPWVPLLCVNQSCQLLWVTGSKLSQTARQASDSARRWSSTQWNMYNCSNTLQKTQHRYGKLMKMSHFIRWFTYQSLCWVPKGYRRFTFSEVSLRGLGCIGVQLLPMKKKHPCTRVESATLNFTAGWWFQPVQDCYGKSRKAAQNWPTIYKKIQKIRKKSAPNPKDFFSSFSARPKPFPFHFREP